MSTLTAINKSFEPWHVLGAGAMGCLWSAALVQHLRHNVPEPVTLLLRNNDALARYPGALTIAHSSDAGAVSDSVVVPAVSVADATGDTVRIRRLLLSCKAHDADAAINSIADFIDDQSIIVLLQNGMGFQQHLSRNRPPGTVFCLSTSSGAWLREPFYAVAAGKGESWFGHLYADTTDHIRQIQQQLLSELPHSGMNIHIDEHMQQRLWEKLAINCAINGLTVIYDCRNGELLSLPAARAHCEALCREITWLMTNIPGAPQMPALWQRVQQVAQTTEHNISSTLQDVRQRRPTEIEHLNGYLCALAAQQELPCPLNRQVLDAVLESARLF